MIYLEQGEDWMVELLPIVKYFKYKTVPVQKGFAPLASLQQEF